MESTYRTYFDPIWKLLFSRTAHLRDGVGEEAVELLVSAVSHPAPPRRVEILPDSSQANGHPLAQQGVRVTELLQADGDQVPLQAGFLDTGHREVVLCPRTQGWVSTTLHYIVSFRLKKGPVPCLLRGPKGSLCKCGLGCTPELDCV